MHIVLIVLLCIVAIIALARSCSRMREELPARIVTLGLLRAAAIAGLVLATIGPVVRHQTSVRIPPRVGLIVDISQSMSLPGSDGESTRLQEASAQAETLSQTVPGARVEWLAMSEATEPVPDSKQLKSIGAKTNLRRAASLAAAGADYDAVAIFSDGADNAGTRGSDLSRIARASGTHFTSVATGRDEETPDVAVDFVHAPQRVRAGSDFELLAVIRRQGRSARPLAIQLLRDGKQLRSDTQPPGAGTVTRRVNLRAGEPGRYTYTLRVSPAAGELVRANNSGSVLVQVVPNKTRVLLIAGAPSMEYAALKRFLLSQDDLDVSLAVRKSAPAEFWRDDARPAKASLDSLFDARKTNAVLLQDAPASCLGSFAGKLASFVRAGGGLAVLGGPSLASGHSGAFAEILPVTGQGAMYVDELVQPQIGADADPLARELSAAVAGGLPALRGRNMLGTLREGANVSIRVQNTPLLVSRRAGTGRVLVLGTDATHRWVFSPSAGGAETHRAFWGTLIDWLTELRDDRPVVAQFDRESYEAGAPARLLVQVTNDAGEPVSNAQVTASLTRGGKKAEGLACAESETAPGRYEATVATDVPGALAARVSVKSKGAALGSDTATAQVAASVTELARSRPNHQLLAAVSEDETGKPGELRVEPKTVTRVKERSFARESWMWFLIVGLLCCEWALRRRWGL